MLAQLGTQHIRDQYFYGYYGQFHIVVDKTDGYINASNLCLDGGKKFYHWSETKISKQLIDTLKHFNYDWATNNAAIQDPWYTDNYSPLNDEVTRYIQTNNISDNDKAISGTYCHPLLIPHIACWISPEFALKVASIVNFFIMEEWQKRFQECQAYYQQQYENYLNIDYEKLTPEEQSRLLTEDLCVSLTQPEAMKEINSINDDHLDEVADYCSTIIVENEKKIDTHAFTMLKLNDVNSRHPYYNIRCKSHTMSAAIKKLRRQFPNAEVIYQQRKVPNTINLSCKMKNMKVIQSTRNYCTSNCSEEKLLDLLTSLCGTTYPASNPIPLNDNVNIKEIHDIHQ